MIGGALSSTIILLYYILFGWTRCINAFVVTESSRSFLQIKSSKTRNTSYSHTTNLYLSKSNNDSSGYRFGDISRFIAKQATNKVNEITGNDTYKFGDLSKWLDKTAKSRIQEMNGDPTGKKYKYQVGDLTRLADYIAKEQAAKFAGKEKATEYKFGDITKTIILRVQSGEYTKEDVFLALRILFMTGISILPIANILPIRALISLVNFGLANDVKDRVMGVLVTSLDARMKHAITGNANYQLGDITKDKLKQSITNFTGKNTYEFGDFTKKVIELRDDNNKHDGSNKKETQQLTLQEHLINDLAKWDEKFLSSSSENYSNNKNNNNDLSNTEKLAAKELEEWDRKLSKQ